MTEKKPNKDYLKVYCPIIQNNIQVMKCMKELCVFYDEKRKCKILRMVEEITFYMEAQP